MTPQQKAFSDTKSSGFTLYRRLTVGNSSFFFFVSWEIVQLLTNSLTGLLGLGLRATFYKYFFRTCGRRPAIGRGVGIRIPQQISLGNGVLIDDFGSLDVRGNQASISLSDRVSIGRFSIIAAKFGVIELGAGSNIGSYCRIATNSKISFGESVLVGAYSYIGPGNHTEGDAIGQGDQEALIERPMDIKGGVSVGSYSWIGAHVTVLDGVSIGKHAIIGAHSLVTSDVPDWGVAVGIPARVIRIRNKQDKPTSSEGGND